MILVDSINGHIKPEPNRETIEAGPVGAFFCIVWGPIELAPARTHLEVYYTADMGRELFRVEIPAPIAAPKQQEKWWAKLTIRKKKKAD